MKRTIFPILTMMICLVSLTQATEFGYPVEGEPWYFIRAAFADAASLSKESWKVSQIIVNGIRSRDFLLYQGSEEVLGNSIQGQQPFEVKVRFSWKGNQD